MRRNLIMGRGSSPGHVVHRGAKAVYQSEGSCSGFDPEPIPPMQPDTALTVALEVNWLAGLTMIMQPPPPRP